MKQKILILYTSVGLGHKFIARNINSHLANAGYETKTHDVFQLQEGFMVDLGIKLHQFVNNHMPWLWRWLYMSKMFSFFTLPLRVPLAAGNSKNIEIAIQSFRPDMIITTQTSASAAVAYLKRTKKYEGKFVIAFSDYHLHRYWLYEEADFYLANIIEQADEMEQLGVSRSKIAVCGITLLQKSSIDSHNVKLKLGIKPDAKVVLIASGSLGTGMDENFIQKFAIRLHQKDSTAVLIVVTGKNESFKEKLNSLKINNLLVLGFYEPMAELYSISSVYLTKPGGMTIAESLQWNLPVVITHWLPGQEELNYQHLIGKGLVISIDNHNSLDFLSDTVVKVLNENHVENNLEKVAITQLGKEGEILVESINKVFHDV